MSLINDALKRAKAAQQQAPPPLSQGPQLRPVEPPQSPRRSLGLLFPCILGFAALLVVFLVWRVFQNDHASASGEPELVARALAGEPLNATPEQGPPEPAGAASPATFGPTDLPGPVAPEPLPTPPALPMPGAVVTPAAPDVAGLSGTNHPVPVPAEPPPLKLQGVIIHPTRPSAIISGKTVFIGDAVGEARVTALTSRTVTLTGPNGTQVLRLGD